MANIDIHKLQLVLEAKGVKMTTAELKKLQTTTNNTSGSFKNMLLVLGGTAGLGMAFSSVTRQGMEFTNAMSKVKSIMNDGKVSSQALKSQMEGLSKSARELGASTVFTATQVGELQVEFAKLGFSAEEIEGVQKSTLSLASAMQVDLGYASSIAGGTLRMFGLEVSEMGQVVDLMGATFNKSAMDMEKFSNSITYVGPIANQLGVDLQGTNSLLAVLANNMIDGSIAGTSLRQILLEAGNSSSKLAKAMGFPVKSTEDLVKGFKILRDQGLSVAEMEDLVGKRAVSAFSILVEQADNVEMFNETLEDVGGTMERMAEDQLDNLQGDFTKLGSATTELSLKFFMELAPALRESVETMTEFVNAIDEKDVEVFIEAIKGATIAFTAYKTAVILAKMQTISFSRALAKTPWGGVAVSIGLASGALAEYFGLFEEKQEAEEAQKENLEETIKLEKERVNLEAEIQKTREHLTETMELENALYMEQAHAVENNHFITKDYATLIENLTNEITFYQEELARLTAEVEVNTKAKKDNMEVDKELSKEDKKRLKEGERLLNRFRANQGEYNAEALIKEYQHKQSLMAIAGATNDELIALQEEFNIRVKELDDERLMAQLNGASELIGSLSQIYGNFAQAQSQRHEKEMQELKESDKFKNASKEDQEMMIKDLEKEQYKASLKAYKTQKTLSIAVIAIETAERVAQYLLSGNLVGAGLATAVGAGQIAIVESTPPPTRAELGGYLEGPSHAQGGIPIEAEGGEYIIRRSAVNRFGVGFFDQLNQFQEGGMVSNGNAGNMTQNVNINVAFENVVMTDDFIEDDVVPAIDDAFRRGDMPHLRGYIGLGDILS